MEIRPVIMVVGTECSPEVEEEWNRWYTEKHVPILLKFKGMKRASRYQILNTEEGKYPKYLVIYEFEDRQAFEAYTKSPERTAATQDRMNYGDKRGADIRWLAYYEATKTWQK